MGCAEMDISAGLGRLRLIVNVVAEGNGWLDPSRPGVLRTEVTIAPRERMTP